MVSIVSVPKSILTKWADNLYAMGKVIPNAAYANDLLQLARAIYAERELHAGRNESTSPQTVLNWMNRLKAIGDSREIPKDVKMPLVDIYYSMADFLQPSREQRIEIVEQSFESQIFWESVVLVFTLWYEGQSFSLQQRELESELGLNSNLQLQQAIRRLRK